MKHLKIGLASFGVLALLGLATALTMVASAPPPMPKGQDVFGFSALKGPAPRTEAPALKRYPARDGEELAYRFYDSPSERVLIFIHGSSYHGAGYHALASFISQSGAAKVVLPNLRGHYQSGPRRGDVDYVGQYEDDIADLIVALRGTGVQGPVTLGGHSSGGGLVIRFAGGAHAQAVSHYLALAPVIPTSPAVRNGTAGGWANLHFRRLYGLLALNAIGIHGFNALPIIAFNKPATYWDGTETLSYSYRLNVSYHPRYRYAEDIRQMDGKALVLVGANDEAVDGEALRAVFAASAPRAQVMVLPNINHFGIFTDEAVLKTIADWLRALQK
jgi:alpha-beta hydrolase superfamily lysophospholipase